MGSKTVCVSENKLTIFSIAAYSLPVFPNKEGLRCQSTSGWFKSPARNIFLLRNLITPYLLAFGWDKAFQQKAQAAVALTDTVRALSRSQCCDLPNYLHCLFVPITHNCMEHGPCYGQAHTGIYAFTEPCTRNQTNQPHFNRG